MSKGCGLSGALEQISELIGKCGQKGKTQCLMKESKSQREYRELQNTTETCTKGIHFKLPIRSLKLRAIMSSRGPLEACFWKIRGFIGMVGKTNKQKGFDFNKPKQSKHARQGDVCASLNFSM